MKNSKPPIKILLFASSFPPPLVGGSVEYVFNIVSNMPPNCMVIHTGNLNPLEAKKLDELFPQRIIRSSFIRHVLGDPNRNIVIRKLMSLQEYFLWPIVAFWHIILERPDIIHLGEHNFAGVAAWFAQRFLKIPYIFYTYAEEIPILSKRRLHNKIFLKILRSADNVITVSEYTRNLMIKLGIDSKRINIVLPAVSNRKLFPVNETHIDLIRKKYKIEKHKVLLTVGNLYERKGHCSVISALPYMIQFFPDLKYIIVGTGPKENDLKQQIVELDIINHVIITGRIDDTELNCLYEICDLFVMPHRQIKNTLDTEGCPTVFLEASSHGKPVIGGNAGGVSDAIINGQTGYIIDGTDQVALEGIILKLLTNEDLSKKMGEAGRRYTMALTPLNNADKVLQISMKVVTESRSSWK